MGCISPKKPAKAITIRLENNSSKESEEIIKAEKDSLHLFTIREVNSLCEESVVPSRELSTKNTKKILN